MSREKKAMQKKLLVALHKLDLNKSTYEYRMALDLIKGNRVHTVVRSGIYGSNNFTQKVIQILKDLDIIFDLGNDAPRGGKLGTYIEITHANLRCYIINQILQD